MVWGRGALLGVAILTFAVPSAEAQTRVETTGTDSGDCVASPCKTIQFAVDKTGTGGTVTVGAGTFSEGVFFPRRMNLRGSGPALTKIVALTSTDPEDGIFTNWGGRFEGFSVTGGQDTTSAGTRASGLRYLPVGTDTPLVLDDVVAKGGNSPSPGQTGIGLLATPFDGAATGSITATNSTFAPGGGGTNPGIFTSLANGSSAFRRITALNPVESNNARWESVQISSGANVIEDSSLQGIRITRGVLTVERSTIATDPDVGGIALQVGSPASTTTHPKAIVRNSLLQTDRTDTAVVVTDVSDDAQRTALELTNSTVAALKSANGLVVPGTASQPTDVKVTNTVFWQGPGAALTTDIYAGYPIQITRSFYDQVQNYNAGATPAPGTGGNLTGDPGLDANSRPLPGSQLVDGGLPFGGLDLLGAPRSVDGNGDCRAAPDIGAFELQGRAAACPVAPNIAPAISAFGLSKKSFRAKRRKGSKKKLGTSFKFTLSEAARISISLQREAAGRKSGKKCRKPSRKNRKAKRCTRLVKAGTIRASGRPGANTVKFSGKIKSKALRPGRYRATLTATDSAGLRTKSKSIKLRILKP